jgi:hypothetical protein
MHSIRVRSDTDNIGECENNIIVWTGFGGISVRSNERFCNCGEETCVCVKGGCFLTMESQENGLATRNVSRRTVGAALLLLLLRV